MIDHYNKAIFLAPFRTGGVAVSVHCSIPYKQGKGIYTELPDKMKGYKVVGLMRDPVQRLKSVWKYFATLSHANEDPLPSKFKMLLQEDFLKWAPTTNNLADLLFTARRPAALREFLAPQYEAYANHCSGGLAITHLLKCPDGLQHVEKVNGAECPDAILKPNSIKLIKRFYNVDQFRFEAPDVPLVYFEGRQLILK